MRPRGFFDVTPRRIAVHFALWRGLDLGLFITRLLGWKRRVVECILLKYLSCGFASAYNVSGDDEVNDTM